MESDAPRVAICQPYVIFGGRLQVILHMVEVLNDLGIVPDIVTLRLRFEPERIEAHYGRTYQMRFRQLAPNMRIIPDDTSILVFNSLLHRIGRDYDLLINSSNSLMPLPGNQHILHYIHFPRERRLADPSPDIHRPDFRYQPFSLRWLHRLAIQQVYRFRRLHPQHHFVFNSAFTAAALREMYGNVPADTHIVYPPVDFSDYESDNRDRQPAIVSVARFGPSKGQLEQIKLAARQPDVHFHLVGFAHNPAYVETCQAYIQSHGLANVHLHLDAPFDEMIALMHQSKYFLHTMINEPFGLTAVQAIAAGCVPLVHDSGGQREVVPLPQLRYQSLDDVPSILETLEALPASDIDAMVRELQAHAHAHYDEAVFHQQMHDILLPILDELQGKTKTGA